MFHPELQAVKERERRKLRSRALRVPILFSLFATVWFLGINALLPLAVDEPHEMLQWQTYLRVVFVLITSLLLWEMVRSVYGRIETDYLELQDKERQLHASEQRHRDVLDRILEGCQIYDREWRYLYLNPAAEQQNRRPNAELLGQRMPEVWPGIEQSRPFALMQRCMFEREAFHEEVEFVFPDGERGWFDLHGYPVPEGIALFSLEITPRKRAEDALLRLNHELEATVVERTAQLQAALDRAEAADKIKSAFLATMSHELRTPLNSILGFTGILLQGLAGPVNEEQKRQLGMVMRSARHLLDLINDVLDLSKIEAGQLLIRREPVDAVAAVEHVMESVKPQAEYKQLELLLERPPTLPALLADQRRLEQILLNLLSNAIRFTDHGSVTLSVQEQLDWAQQDAPQSAPRAALRFRVRDTGIGIRGEDLQQLFLPFRQVDASLARQRGGTGLGLVICRRLAAMMDGEISVRSQPGAGSEFTLTLPLAAAESP